jgi:hypothetical protein
MFEQNIHQHRSRLRHTRRAIERGHLRIGFVGGSITAPYGHTWPEAVVAWFVRRFPDVRIHVENAAIGATGSDLAVLRVERELIARGCDLVFVEFAVNDAGFPAERALRTEEGLVRKLLAGPGRDVVFTYTYAQDMYPTMITGNVPEPVRRLEKVAAHYGIGSVWMGLHALREVQAGTLRWHEWLPDGLHTQHRGSLCYAESVNAFLERNCSVRFPRKRRRQQNRPPRSRRGIGDRRNYSRLSLFGPSDRGRSAALPTPGRTRSWTRLRSGRAWSGSSKGAASRSCSISGNAPRSSGTGGGRRTLVDVVRDRPPWGGESGMAQIYVVADDLPVGVPHRFHLEVTHGGRPECTGTDCRLASIGVIP